MKERLPSTKPVESWLVEVFRWLFLPPCVHSHLFQTLSSSAAVGIDPAVVSMGIARKYQKAFDEARKDMKLVSVTENLIDKVWGSEQPAPPTERAMVQSNEYSGSPARTSVRC